MTTEQQIEEQYQAEERHEHDLDMAGLFLLTNLGLLGTLARIVALQTEKAREVPF